MGNGLSHRSWETLKSRGWDDDYFDPTTGKIVAPNPEKSQTAIILHTFDDWGLGFRAFGTYFINMTLSSHELQSIFPT